MASKETSTAGFVNVSREITGELDEFIRGSSSERRPESSAEGEKGMRAGVISRKVSFSSLCRSLNLRFPVRLI